MSQTLADKLALRAAWEAHPTVRAFRAAVEAHVRASGLEFTPEGMTATAQFANAWIAKHGPLPESGILLI